MHIMGDTQTWIVRYVFTVLVVICHCLQRIDGQTFQVRLIGGTNSSNGRVEVFNGNVWGTVCDDKWEDQDATVICRMVGYSRGLARGAVNGVPPYGPGTVIIALDDVNCFGTEVNIGQCQHRGWGIHDCQHAEDAGVQCVGDPSNPRPTTRPPVTAGPVPDNCPGNQPSPNIRLYGTVTGIGIVEVFNPARNQWGSVCDDNFGQREAMVVCRMLCYNIRYARAGAREDMVRATPRLSIQLDDLGCSGNENSILDCPSDGWGVSNCNDTTEAVRVTCVPQDYLAPPPPIPTVACENALILASFNRTVYPDIEDKHLDVDNSPANCNVRKRQTTTLAEIAIPFDECGTMKKLNATHIVYNNTVRIASTYLQGNVYRKNTYRVYLACEFARAGRVDDNGVQPLTESVSQRATGQYNFQMTFFRNDNLTQAETVFPIRINLGEFINVGVTLEDVDTGLKLIVPSCRASPTLDPNSNVRYPLISDRCPTDQSLATFPWNRTTFGFRFQTIKFLGNNPVFYVTCDTFVCTLTEKNAACDQSCSTDTTGKKKRRRRQAHDDSRTVYHVGGGPFQILTAGDTIDRPPVQVQPLSTTPFWSPTAAPPHREPSTTGNSSSITTLGRVLQVTTMPSPVAWPWGTTQIISTVSTGMRTTLATPSSTQLSKFSTAALLTRRRQASPHHPSTSRNGTPQAFTTVTATTTKKASQKQTEEVNVIRVPQVTRASSASARKQEVATKTNNGVITQEEPHSQPNSQTDSKGKQRLALPHEIVGTPDGSGHLRVELKLLLSVTSLVFICFKILS